MAHPNFPAVFMVRKFSLVLSNILTSVSSNDFLNGYGVKVIEKEIVVGTALASH
jgi:hypothetical protein